MDKTSLTLSYAWSIDSVHTDAMSQRPSRMVPTTIEPTQTTQSPPTSVKLKAAEPTRQGAFDWHGFLVVYLFHVTCWIIMYHWFYHPDALPSSYRVWIDRLARMPEEPLAYLRLLREGKVVEGRRGGRRWLETFAMWWPFAVRPASSTTYTDGRRKDRYGVLLTPGQHCNHFDTLCKRHGFDPIIADPYYGYGVSERSYNRSDDGVIDARTYDVHVIELSSHSSRAR